MMKFLTCQVYVLFGLFSVFDFYTNFLYFTDYNNLIYLLNKNHNLNFLFYFIFLPTPLPAPLTWGGTILFIYRKIHSVVFCNGESLSGN